MEHTDDRQTGNEEAPLEPHRTGIAAGRIALAVFLGIALFFLITEHRAHLYGALPYLLLLACPLMHLFHRHGRGGHHRSTAHPHGDRRTGAQGDWK